MTKARKQFEAELKPLLEQCEVAIVERDVDQGRRLAVEMLALTHKYANTMSYDEIRDALNNPTANAIAERLRRLGIMKQ